MINMKNRLNRQRFQQSIAATSSSRAISTVVKPAIVLLICATSISSYAAILSEDSERRIQVRYGNDNSSAYISSGSTATTSINQLTGDSMQGLIEQKQRQFNSDSKLSIKESQRVNTNQIMPTYNTRYSNTFAPSYSTNDNMTTDSDRDFNSWLNSNSWRAQQVSSYQQYLSSRLGAQNVPPLSQLLTTARSWEKCGYEPYQLPPQELWANMVPTLRLYSDLKSQGILPASTEIRSVYRSPSLNACAGGATGSKHMTAGAMDIWVPEYNNDVWGINRLQDSLCQFWQYQGNSHNFGLGLYPTGSIHLDTQGYRKWGFQNASSSSACRF